MSDAATHDGPLPDPHGSLAVAEVAGADRRRSLASLGAALGIHAVLFAAFALGLGSIAAAGVVPPLTIELQASAAGGRGPGGADSTGGGSGSADAAIPSPAAPSAAPAAPAARPSTGASASSGANEFVIPTPRSPASGASSSAAAGPAFRESGGRTGVATGISSAPDTAPSPEVPPIRQGTGSGSGSASGSGASSVQRSGTGVTVGGTGQETGGSLDFPKLDRALAAGGSASGSGTGSGGPASGTGTASGSGTSTGTGAGSGSSAGVAGSGSQPYAVQWGSESAGEGRKMVIVASPQVPAWVQQQGLRLSVTVSFHVLADGTISVAAIPRSSGYRQVDEAVVNAIRLCLFNSVPNAPTVRGVITYVIKPE